MTYTVSAVTAWGRATLEDRANAVATMADSFRRLLSDAELSADQTLGEGWSGTAATAAADRVETEIRLGKHIVDAVDDLVATLRTHAGSILGVRDNVLAKVADAQVEFGVSDSFQVDHSGPPEKRQQHVDAISTALTELAEVDREVAFALDACCDEIASYARDSRLLDDYAPPVLAGLSSDDITRLLGDPEFTEWVDQHPDAAKSLLDAAVDAGQLSATSAFYKEFLQGFWQREALERAGIDVSQWNPAAGTEANADTINRVYEYYGQLFLDHPSLQWAGMANMIGPSFAGGFYDLEMLRDVADEVNNFDIPGVNPIESITGPASILAGLTEADIEFYETTLLSMQKEIFFDQGAMHEAYLLGGMDEINRMRDAELIDPQTQDAWRMIDRGAAAGDQALLAEGNQQLLHREQWDIIADDYDRMRNHPITGGAVTWGMTTVGTPSIPGAQAYPEVFPDTISQEIPQPWYVDIIPGVPDSVEIGTPFPDGNISNVQQRWNLITEDTLPAYQRLLTDDPDRAREIIGSDFQSRLEGQRIGHTIDDIVWRLAHGWSIGLN